MNKTELKDLLEEQLELFEKLYELCKEQSQLLSEDGIEKLEASLTESQKIREKINGLHHSSQPLMQSYLSLKPEQKDDTIDNLTERIRQLVESSAEINANNMDVMKAMTQEHSKKIDEQRAKREGIGGYAQAIVTPPELFDKTT